MIPGLAAALTLVAAEPGPTPSCEASMIAATTTMAEELALTGAALVAGGPGGRSIAGAFGDIELDAPIPVASASKWVAAVTILHLVEDGVLDLDAPITAYLPDAPDFADQITLRMLLSHRSGVNPRAVFRLLRSDGVSASARRLLRLPLDHPPGEYFNYGGGSFQIAGAMAEAATGLSWAEIFERHVAQPYGLTTAVWAHPGDIAATATPQLGGGLWISPADYARFLDGFSRANGLSEATYEAVFIDTAAGAARAGVPEVIGDSFGYGLGVWCVGPSEDRCVQVHSAGAFGTYPWFDRGERVWGAIFVQDRLPRVHGTVTGLAEQTTRCLARESEP